MSNLFTELSKFSKSNFSQNLLRVVKSSRKKVRLNSPTHCPPLSPNSYICACFPSFIFQNFHKKSLYKLLFNIHLRIFNLLGILCILPSIMIKNNRQNTHKNPASFLVQIYNTFFIYLTKYFKNITYFCRKNKLKISMSFSSISPAS